MDRRSFSAFLLHRTRLTQRWQQSIHQVRRKKGSNTKSMILILLLFMPAAFPREEGVLDALLTLRQEEQRCCGSLLDPRMGRCFLPRPTTGPSGSVLSAPNGSNSSRITLLLICPFPTSQLNGWRAWLIVFPQFHANLLGSKSY